MIVDVSMCNVLCVYVTLYWCVDVVKDVGHNNYVFGLPPQLMLPVLKGRGGVGVSL